MALMLNKVHDYQKVPGKRHDVRLVGEHHYVRLGGNGLPPIFIQDGHCYSEGGEELALDKLSEPFWVEARKITPEMRRTVGLVLPEERQKPEPVVPAAPVSAATPGPVDKAEATRTCPTCNETMLARKFGAHISLHRRRLTKDI